MQLKFDDIPEPDIEEAGPLSMPIGILQIRLKSQPEIMPPKPKWQDTILDLLSDRRIWEFVRQMLRLFGASTGSDNGIQVARHFHRPGLLGKSAP